MKQYDAQHEVYSLRWKFHISNEVDSVLFRELIHDLGYKIDSTIHEQIRHEQS